MSGVESEDRGVGGVENSLLGDSDSRVSVAESPSPFPSRRETRLPWASPLVAMAEPCLW